MEKAKLLQYLDQISTNFDFFKAYDTQNLMRNKMYFMFFASKTYHFEVISIFKIRNFENIDCCHFHGQTELLDLDLYRYGIHLP